MPPNRQTIFICAIILFLGFEGKRNGRAIKRFTEVPITSFLAANLYNNIISNCCRQAKMKFIYSVISIDLSLEVIPNATQIVVIILIVAREIFRWIIFYLSLRKSSNVGLDLMM